MCNALAEIGHNVYLITRGNKNKIKDHNYYDVAHKFKIIKLPIKNIRFISSLVFSLFVLIKIIQIKPKLIYSRHRFSLIVTRLFNIPVIFEDHSPPDGIYKHIIKSSINKNITNIVLISHALEKLYNRVLPSISRVKVIVAHDGADPIKRKPESIKNPIKINNNLKIGYIGHLHTGRGIDIILAVAEKIDFHDFHIIGGDDKDLDYWKSRNKQKNVIFHGYKINSEISELLIQFDILIAPYQYKVFINNGLNTASWMSPLKIFEYMSAGKPIVSSKLNVLEEVLTHNYNALLVKPDDVEEWIKSINLLCDDKKLRQKIGKQALTDFNNKYKWQKRAENILASALN